MGHPIGIPLSLVVLGHIALDQGDVERAALLIGDSLTTYATSPSDGEPPDD